MPKTKKHAKPAKKSVAKLKALILSQHINELLSRTLTESEALQNSGDDRPVYESHVTDLLEGKRSRRLIESKKEKQKGKGSKRKRQA